MDLVGAIDVGGTKIAAGLVDESGAVLEREVVPTEPERDFAYGLARIQDMLRRCLQRRPGARLAGVGVGCTGPVDPLSGLLGPNSFLPRWEGINTIERIQAAFGVSVAVENDADAAALGEFAWGAGQSASRCIYVTVSTGIGCGIIIDGRLYRGAGGAHPELGHMIIDPGRGPACFCGARGCWESLASGPALSAWYAARRREMGKPLENLVDAREVCLRAPQGDAAAQEAVLREGDYLGIGLANLITTFVPDVLVLGGGVLESWPLFESRVRSTIRQCCGLVPHERTSLRRASLGDRTGLAGAARVWFHKYGRSVDRNEKLNRMKKKSCAKIFLWLISGLAGLCLLLSAISAFANSRMPTRSPVIDRLTDADKARLAEVNHLRQALGEEIIPGWSRADIPLILYNEQYVFLVSYPQQPPDGWEKIPIGQRRGGAWELVLGDTFESQPYYRQAYPGPGSQPENFTVRVGERWVASLMTLDWFKISLADRFQTDVPAPFKAVVPYQLMVSFIMGSSDQYMTSMHHEAAHAYQGMQAPAKLAAAETAANTLNERYPWDDEKLAADWQAELNCLRDAMRAGTQADTRAQAIRFLNLRRSRRQSAKLSAGLVDLERKREWEEGFAKYTEISVYRLAATTIDYAPVPALKNDAQFHNYRDFPQRWQNEVNQIATIGRQKDEIRYYYSGWAQSELLDRLSPGWKAHLFDENIWLEDLLAAAVLHTPQE